MKPLAESLSRKQLFIGAAILALLVLSAAALSYYGYKRIQDTEVEREVLRSELEATRSALMEKELQVQEYGNTLSEIQQAYAVSEENGTELLKMLTEEKERNEAFEGQIKKISGTVGKLDKLSKLDPELLMKYSKVYFLNEHYMPGKIEEIPTEFTKAGEKEFIDSQVFPFLMDLLTDAKEDGIDLIVASAYRSYDEQKGLKSTYTIQYGSGANTFSADQGYSEHQLGTTVDFTVSAIGGALTPSFETTEAFSWLSRYAYKYGFVLSYPKNNAYYMYEPWHWRFVGEDLADDLHDDGKNFYDLEQREIDKYLISIFD